MTFIFCNPGTMIAFDVVKANVVSRKTVVATVVSCKFLISTSLDVSLTLLHPVSAKAN